MCWTSLLVLSRNTWCHDCNCMYACACFPLLCDNTILPFKPKSKSESQNFEVSWKNKFQLSWKVSWKSFKWVEFQNLKSLPGLDYKGKPFWILMKQKMMGDSGIIWTICKSFARHSRQITAPVPHHSVFRSSPQSWPNKPGKKCPSVTASVHTSVRPQSNSIQPQTK